jgi:uncharacterized membrane protein YkoI
MKTYRFVPAILLTLSLITACNNNAPTESGPNRTTTVVQGVSATEITAADAAMKALQLVPGKIDNVERVSLSNGNPGWEVVISMSKKWIVTAQLDAMSGGLVGMSGNFSPENFDFAPGAYFVPLSNLYLSIQRNMDAQITSWSFEHSASYNEWVYNLDIRKDNGASNSIIVSAVSRQILNGAAS